MPQDPFPGEGQDSQEPGSSAPSPAADGGRREPGRRWPGDQEVSAAPGPAAGGVDPGRPGESRPGESRPGESRPGESRADEPPEGAEQGLFVCLPAEQLTLAGFAQDGTADTMAPGALLAAVVEAVTGEDGAGLAGLSDDQLAGIMSAARRMESRAAWTLMAALREFARRRPAGQRPGDTGRAGFSEFAADEVADELHLTWQSAAEQIEFACAVADRLPRTFAALAAGTIHPVHVRIIEDETRVLSGQDAARADEKLAETAGPMTFGQLRYAAHRLVLKLDPDAARRRKESAKHDAHVRRFREDSGNAGMIARELPPDEVLASWQHVEQRALDLRAAGIPGTLTELRVRAYLDLLQERDSRAVTGDDSGAGQADGRRGQDGSGGSGGPQDGNDAPDRHGSPQDGPGGTGGNDGQPDGGNGPGTGGNGGAAGSGPRNGGNDGAAGSGPRNGGNDGAGGSGPRNGGNGGPAGAGGKGAGGSLHPAQPGTGASLAALVNITVPLSALLGDPAAPGEAAGFGLLDAHDARDLVAAAARHPGTRWCLTALHPDGTAAAHGCATGRHRVPPGPADPGTTGGTSRAGPDPPPGTRPPDYLRALPIRLVPIARGRCDHAHAETGYQPSRILQRLIRARNTRCTAPGCGRPAARCDLDHTLAWDQGGITCECDLAPLCRHHHRCKQSQGWKLEQPSPGVLVWRTPSGRTYTTTPTVYSV